MIESDSYWNLKDYFTELILLERHESIKKSEIPLDYQFNDSHGDPMSAQIQNTQMISFFTDSVLLV